MADKLWYDSRDLDMDPFPNPQPASLDPTATRMPAAVTTLAQEFQEALADLMAILELDKVLRRIAAIGAKFAGADSVQVFLRDSPSGTLTHVSEWSGDKHMYLPQEPPAICITVATSGRPEFVVGTDGALACLPLVKEDRVLGILNLGYAEPRHFDGDLCRLLESLSRHAALAIDNARVYGAATRSTEQLRRLYDTNLDITSQLEIARLIEVVIRRASDLLYGDSGNFYLYDERTGEMVPTAPFGEHEVEAVYRFKPGEGAAGHVLLTGEPLMIADYDEWEGRYPDIPRGHFARILHVPVKQGTRVLGVMAVNRPRSAPEFSEEDKDLLMLFANQVGIAIENARLYQVATDKARLERELLVARQVQDSLIPQSIPQPEGWNIEVHWQPAREVSGDFFDFLPLPDGRLGFVVGDATGKGVPAALMMATARALLRGTVMESQSPGQVLRRVNDLLQPDRMPNTFVTVFYAVLEPGTGKFCFANAGHNLPYERTGNGIVQLRATGVPLGLLPGVQYEEKQTIIAPGASLVFYSDGVVEAHNAQGQMFGFPRLASLVAQAEDTLLIQFLLKELAAFTGPDWEQEDDITLVTLHRK